MGKEELFAVLIFVFINLTSGQAADLGSSSYRVEIERAGQQPSIIVPENRTKTARFTVTNNHTETRTLNISLDGLEARFRDGSKFREFTLSANEVRGFSILLNGTEKGERTLEIVSEDDLGVKTSFEFNVLVKDFNTVSPDRSVPGISYLNLLVLFAGSLLYFVFFIN